MEGCNYILHVLSFQISYVFKESGLTEFLAQNVRAEVDLHLPWLNPRSKAEEDKKVFFRQLTKAEVKQVFDAYRVDHDLFGYNIEPYLSFAKE